MKVISRKSGRVRGFAKPKRAAKNKKKRTKGKRKK